MRGGIPNRVLRFQIGRGAARLGVCFSICLMLVMAVRSEDDFVRMMSSLEGQAFQDEVCAFLQKTCVSDFQTVPPHPRGDGGLDGYSHKQTVGYCCYGPEEASKATAPKLKAAILKKFRGDLRNIFELRADGKGKAEKLVHCETAEMKTILAQGVQLKIVRLIVSVFDSHQILAPLNEAFAIYMSASQRRYIDKKAVLTIWGPKQLATKGAVDDLTIARLEQRETLRRVTAAIGGVPHTLPTSSDFDAKFDWIEAHKKASKDSVARMRIRFRKRWSAAVAIENDLSNNSPIFMLRLRKRARKPQWMQTSHPAQPQARNTYSNACERKLHSVSMSIWEPSFRQRSVIRSSMESWLASLASAQLIGGRRDSR
jgi:hypothetical protein